MYFCSTELPATKQMLPKLVAVLKSCLASDQSSNQWYIILQQNIENHYLTEGNCFFFGDAKEILSGEMEYDLEEIKKLRGLSLQ
jgi:hypothetical protein